MRLSERLYFKCSGVLAAKQRSSRTRGSGAFVLEPLVWETILLTVHFLCVVHAVNERDVFKRLAERWRDRRIGGGKAQPPDTLLTDTNAVLQKLEDDLHKEVVKSVHDQIDAARDAVSQILISYAGTKAFPLDAASQIVEEVAEALQEEMLQTGSAMNESAQAGSNGSDDLQ